MGYSISDVKELKEKHGETVSNAAIQKILGGYSYDRTINEWAELKKLTDNAELKKQIEQKQADLVDNNRGGDSVLTKIKNFF